MSRYRPDASVDPQAYAEDYFLTECDGYEEYLNGQDLPLPSRLRTLWYFLDVEEGMRVLDLGCGRGEILVYCAAHGIPAIGLDYSDAALDLTRRAIVKAEQVQGDNRWERPVAIAGNAKALPLPDQTVDRVIMSDIVEHLYPPELDKTLREVHRVLPPGGELLIHTMPNLWYYWYGYPLFRLVQMLRGVSLPSDPRERFAYSHVHVNEQTPWKLHQSLSRAVFSFWRVWLYDYRDYAQHIPILRLFMRLLTKVPLLKLIFCDDIFARARK